MEDWPLGQFEWPHSSCSCGFHWELSSCSLDLPSVRVYFSIFQPTVNASPGFRITISRRKSSNVSTKNDNKSSGLLYVCNHRTLMDPIVVSTGTMKPLTAVTYSMSRFTKNIRLTRDQENDRKVMEKLLSQDDLSVCPEGTTCREPYLLRFSPLFTESTDEIVPVAIDLQVGMPYGSTASGCKCLDPLVNLFNPFVKIQRRK